MKQNQFISLVGLLMVVSGLLYFIQNFVVESLGDNFIFYYPVWKIYVFHFFVTFFIFSLLYIVGKIAPQHIGFTFMGFILFKMVAAVVFLLPFIKMEGVSKIPDFISFFAPYFVFLFFEIILTMRILKQSEEKFRPSANLPKNKNA